MFCIFFQIFSVKPWMDTCYIVSIIIRIMYVNNIRFSFLKTIAFPIQHFYILRIILSLIMHLSKTSVRISLKVWNRYAICVTIRVLFRRQIDALQAVPHRRFIREKDNLFPRRNIMLHTVFYFQKLIPQPFLHPAFIEPSFLGFLKNIIKQPAIFLQISCRNMLLFLQSFYDAAQADGKFLTLAEHILRLPCIFSAKRPFYLFMGLSETDNTVQHFLLLSFSHTTALFLLCYIIKNVQSASGKQQLPSAYLHNCLLLFKNISAVIKYRQ